MRNFFRSKSAKNCLATTSTLPSRNESMSMRCGENTALPAEKAVIQGPADDATPSVITASTGFDDSHTTRRKAQCKQPKQAQKIQRNNVHDCKKSFYDPDEYIKPKVESHKSTSGILQRKREEDSTGTRFDDDHDDDDDINQATRCQRSYHSSRDDFTSTSAYIVESKGSYDSFKAHEQNIISQQSSETSYDDDDDHSDHSRGGSTSKYTPPPMKTRISALTEAIAMKQSDIAVQFCSMMQRMRCIVEDMEKMQNTNCQKEWRAKSSKYMEECRMLHETAIKMANKQVLMAHQGTKYVERLEQEMADLQRNYQLLLSPHKVAIQNPIHEETIHSTQQSPLPPTTKSGNHRLEKKILMGTTNGDDSCTTTEKETKFCIREVAFCHKIVVDVVGVSGAMENPFTDTDSSSGISGLASTGGASQLRFLL